jgi:hypothetical protein
MPAVDVIDLSTEDNADEAVKMNSVWDDDSSDEDSGTAGSAASTSVSSSSASAARKEEARMKPPANYTLESFNASRKGASGRRESHDRFRSAGSEAGSGGRAVKKKKTVVVSRKKKPQPKKSGIRGQPSHAEVAQVNDVLAAFGQKK